MKRQIDIELFTMGVAGDRLYKTESPSFVNIQRSLFGAKLKFVTANVYV